jgi:hypothetical protein
MAGHPKRSLFRRLARIVGRTLLTIFVILVIVFLLIQTPFVQNIARGKAESYLSRKLNTRVRIGNLHIRLFRSVTLENVYIGDRQKDTLLAARLIDVQIRMLGLLHHDLDIRQVQLRDLTVKIDRRLPDTAFNYQFIVDAFSGPPSSKPEKTAGQPMKIGLRELLLDRIRFVYKDSVTGNDIAVWVGHGLAKLGRVDMAKEIFQINDIQLDSTNVGFDNNRQKRQKTGMDYAHLRVRQLDFVGRDLTYTPDSISGTIRDAAFLEQSGFRLTRLRTKFFYSDRRAWLGDLFLQTPGSLLQRTVSLSCDSMAGMMKNPAHTWVDLDLAGSRVRVQDLLIFVPSLRAESVFSHPDEVWSINARVKGSFDSLNIQTLQFSGIRDWQLDLAGRVGHPFDVRRLEGDLQLRRMSGSRAALLGFLPKGAIPSNIRLPNSFDLTGRIAGSMDDLRPDLVLNTSSGRILLKGRARNIRSVSASSYDLELKTQTLQLGRILPDSLQWGAVTADFTVKGQGFDMRSAHAVFSGRVASAMVRQYTYTGLSIDGSIADRQVQLQSAIRDSAVRFELTAAADLKHQFPALRLDWQIDTLDLRALHLVHDTLAFKGHIVAGFADTNPDSLQGELKLTGIRLMQGGRQLSTDSIVLVAARKGDLEDIQLHSEMADLDWSGHYKLTETVQALEHTIDHYYHPGGNKDSVFSPQDWTMRLRLRASPLVLAYLPSLKGTDSLGASMSFNSRLEDLHLHFSTPHVQIGAQQFDRLDLAAGTSGDRLNYDLQIAGGSGSGFELHRSWLAGGLHQGRLTTALVLQDDKGKDRFRLAGELDRQPDGLKLVFNPDSLLLNYVAWQVSRDNSLRYDSAGIVIHDFVINHANDTLSVNSAGGAPSSPINIRFANFSMGTLSRLADQDSVLVDGTINGTVQLKNILSHPVFTSDLLIRRLTYTVDTLGDLAIKVNNEKDSVFTADLSLEGNSNDVKVKGEYFTGAGRMKMQLTLGQLNLATFNHVAAEEVESMKGYLKGQLAVSGTLDKPVLKGDLHFDSSLITPVVSGEPLRLSKDNIEFDEDGFNFSKFTLLDSSGNKLVVDGNVYTHDYRDYSFDISVNAANFRLVNAPEESSRQFYGVLDLDAAINLEGDMSSPKVDGDVKVNRKTNFYLVLPGSDPEVVGREGVVRFVDHNHPGDTLIDRAALVARARQAVIKGADVSLSIQTDSNALFTMVIDERTGDILSARGRSSLVFGMDKSGKTSLTGSFEVSSGAYNLSLDVLKRSFVLQRGSIITWTGDPRTATLDLTATYTAVTPSIDLISNEVAGRPPADVNKFKEKLPFLVTLKMSGELMKPTITFDISLPPNILSLWPDVDQRLTQIRGEESELNKQVFALLLLNRFVGEDPLQSQAGGGSSVGSLAFQSASQILTNQMDQLANSLIKGVDIHFDLNNQQDYSTGSEIDYTELGVTVSKKLFSERIQVNVGSNFDVMGVGAPNQNASTLAGDVSVDYKLSKDGRYRLRAYRQNQYDEVVEGQVVETGLSFILTLDYNSLKELFRRSQEVKLIERTTTKPVSPASSNP